MRFLWWWGYVFVSGVAYGALLEYAGIPHSKTFWILALAFAVHGVISFAFGDSDLFE